MARLLILSCSNRKRRDAGLLPAIDRYDGQAYRVLAGYRRAVPDDAIDVLILSAGFGLIDSETPIAWYDRQMTLDRAAELQRQVSADVRNRLTQGDYHRALFYGGARYRAALDTDLVADARLTFTSGPIGAQLSMLKTWLYGARQLPAVIPDELRHIHSSPRIRGVTLDLTFEQAVERARTALATGQGDPNRFSSWYVDLDGQQVAPKWLVSVLTGLSLSDFVTTEARRVLMQLGFEVWAVCH